MSGRTKRGVFIVLEGPDKSGKSTQAGLLVRYLRGLKRRQGRRERRTTFRVVHTREPGGTSFAEAIRRVLLDPEHRVHPVAELLLYEAARAQHTYELLRPALERGSVVICERFTLATLVYQGRARKLPLALIRQLNSIATGGLKPDLTLVLDIPESEFSSRHRRRAHDRLERESTLFRRKVRDGYRALSRSEPKTVLIDAHRHRDQVQEDIRSHVRKMLKLEAIPKHLLPKGEKVGMRGYLVKKFISSHSPLPFRERVFG